MAQPDRRALARPIEVADTVGLTTAQLKQMRYLGQGPKFIRVTGRQIRYRWEDVDAWLDSQTCSRADQRPTRETA
jgi:predicted DNA-binding transcriptional regulator AlpA